MSQSFSLIIPAHNSEKYISACLQSVLKQKLNKKKYEIIIINDASSDKTLTKADLTTIQAEDIRGSRLFA